MIYIPLAVYLDRDFVMQVAKWGNSLAVRLPQSVVDALKLKDGDQIEIQVMGARTLEVDRKPAPRELLTRLRKLRGRLPADFKFDRLEANERR
jgi:antitoxin MazE